MPYISQFVRKTLCKKWTDFTCQTLKRPNKFKYIYYINNILYLQYCILLFSELPTDRAPEFTEVFKDLVRLHK